MYKVDNDWCNRKTNKVETTNCWKLKVTGRKKGIKKGKERKTAKDCLRWHILIFPIELIRFVAKIICDRNYNLNRFFIYKFSLFGCLLFYQFCERNYLFYCWIQTRIKWKSTKKTKQNGKYLIKKIIFQIILINYFILLRNFQLLYLTFLYLFDEIIQFLSLLFSYIFSTFYHY